MRVVLTGASGQLGAYLLPRLNRAGHQVSAWSHSTTVASDGTLLRPVDLTDLEATWDALERYKPEVVIHAAAMSSSDAVRQNPQAAHAINVQATMNVLSWCKVEDVRILFTSTDLVFSGARPYSSERLAPQPVMEYGRGKELAEQAVQLHPNHLIARISLLYGPSRCGRENFFDRSIGMIRAGQLCSFFENEYRTPLHYRNAADVLTRLVDHEAVGVLHVGGPERVSRYELMRRAVAALGDDEALVKPNRWVAAEQPEPRPADVSLDTTRLITLFPDLNRPTIEQSISAVSD